MPLFPILEKIQVNGFALYEGEENSSGLEHSFSPGTNVVLGINGLGKTTLLNIILRVLTGPFDVKVEGGLKRGQRELSKFDKYFFSKRDPGGAETAVAVGTFKIGENRIEVSRSLADLSLKGFSINGREVPLTGAAEDETTYQDKMRQIADYGSFFDFVLILRYLVFYLEDRASCFWDTYTQPEIIRILFFSKDCQEEYREQFNLIAQKDSLFRNYRSILNKLLRDMTKEERKKSQITKSREELEGTLAKLETRLNELANELKERDRERRKLRSLHENAKLEIDNIERDLGGTYEDYYRTLLPDLSERAALLLLNAATGRGCMVCGSDVAEDLERLKARAENNSCPLCEANIPHMDSLPEGPENSLEKLKLLQSSRDELKEKSSEYARSLKTVQSQFLSLRVDLAKAYDEHEQVKQQLSLLEGDGKNPAQKKREEQEFMMGKIQVDIDENTKSFEKILIEELPNIRVIAADIIDYFKKYISAFMAEKCSLHFGMEKWGIGQQGRPLSFPKFSVKMTSNVFGGSETSRSEGSEVSESQQEFIELAFRMALVSAADAGGTMMMVLETPEASLDTVFMDKAGSMLRELAGAKNTVIASSNLSRERLVPAMLGIPSERDIQLSMGDDDLKEKLRSRAIPVQERRRYVLDLLGIAKANAALEEFREAYENRREESLFPHWEKPLWN